VKEVYVLLLSQIGMPVDKPKLATAQVLLERRQTLKNAKADVYEIFKRAFKNIDHFCEELSRGKYSIC